MKEAQAVNRWSEAFPRAVAGRHVRLLDSLAQAADNRASKLENATNKVRQAEFRNALSGNRSSFRGHGHPTRLAFRFVRGLQGWSQSPIGSAEHEEYVPDEEFIEGRVSADSCTSADALAAPLSEQASVDVEAGSWAEN